METAIIALIWTAVAFLTVFVMAAFVALIKMWSGK